MKYFLFIILMGFILGCASILFPFGRDHGTFAYIAKLILEGKIDYKFAIDLKLPAIHYTFVLGQVLFGKSMVAMRLFDIIWQIATAFVVFLITRKMTKSNGASLISAFFYMFLYYRMDYWQTMQTESFMNLPFSLCIYFVLNSEDMNYKKFFIGGIFFAITFLYKFTVSAYLILLPLIIIFNSKDNLKEKFNRILFFFIGFISMIAVVFMYLYINGALVTMLDDQFNQISRYAEIGYGTESSSFIARNFIKLFLYSVYSPLILLTIILIILLFKNKIITINYLFLFIWFISAMVSLIGQWKFFIYHFLILIPPIVICSICLIRIIKEKYQLRKYKYLNYVGWVLIVLIFIAASKPYLSYEKDLLSYISGKSSLHELYIKNGTTPDTVFTMKKVFSVTEYVQENTGTNDNIFIWGFEPLIYYISGRDCVSRFIYNHPLIWKGDNSQYRMEFLSELKKNNPKLILVAKRDQVFTITGFSEDSEAMLYKFIEFKKIIDDNYEFTTEIQEFKIYKLKKSFYN